MARTWDDKEKELANINMMIANTRGAGGSPGQSYQRPLQNPDPGEAVFGVEKGGQGFFEFLKAMGLNKNNKGTTIAGGPYRMNKEGNAEVWDLGPKNYHYNPMPKSYYDLIESVKGMNFKKAGLDEFDTLMDRFRKGNQNPKSGTLKHHSDDARKLILSIGKRIRA